jgi:hypothetical protein
MPLQPSCRQRIAVIAIFQEVPAVCQGFTTGGEIASTRSAHPFQTVKVLRLLAASCAPNCGFNPFQGFECSFDRGSQFSTGLQRFRRVGRSDG